MTSASTILGGASVEPGSVGGKVFALNRLIEMGASAPPTGQITTDGYRWFVGDLGSQRSVITHLTAATQFLRSLQATAHDERAVPGERPSRSVGV